MILQVQLFAVARDAVGTSSVTVELPERACVSDLRRQLVSDFPNLNSIAKILLVAVNQQYAGDDQLVSEGDSIACFPPVSGG
jgi:molybdopterin converting factor subunit 1